MVWRFFSSPKALTYDYVETLHPGHAIDNIKARSSRYPKIVHNEVYMLRVATNKFIQGSLVFAACVSLQWTSVGHETYWEDLRVGGELVFRGFAFYATDREEQALQVGKLRQRQS